MTTQAIDSHRFLSAEVLSSGGRAAPLRRIPAAPHRLPTELSTETVEKPGATPAHARLPDPLPAPAGRFGAKAIRHNRPHLEGPCSV